MTDLIAPAPATSRSAMGPTILRRRPLRSVDRVATASRRRHLLEMGLAVGVPVALLALWQGAAAAGWIDERLYPPPTDIWDEATSLIADGELDDHVLVTTRRVLSGFGIGAVAGFVAGTAMGLSRLTRAAFEPLLTGLYVVPKLALLPIFMTIFGLGDASQVVLVSATVFFFVWISTMEAFVSVPDGYREAARSLDVSRIRMFGEVLLPAALPQLFVALRIAMGVAVLVIVPTEFLVSNEGLGYLIFHSRELFIHGQMFVGIVTVAVEGVVLAGIVAWVGRRLTPWEPRQRGGWRSRW